MDSPFSSAKLMLIIKFSSNICIHEVCQWIQSSDCYSVRLPKYDAFKQILVEKKKMMCKQEVLENHFCTGAGEEPEEGLCLLP